LKKALVNSPTHSELEERIVACVRAASMEITPSDQEHLPALRGLLSKGTAVYISHVPTATLAHVVKTALAVQSAGFKATPHIAARRITYPENLRAALAELTAGGVEQVLLIAGDAEHAAGEFDSTLDVLESGILEKSAIKSIGFAGYPEGQRGIGPMLLWNALKMKQAFADRTGLAVHIVTQFGFNGNALRDWEPELKRHDVRLPIRAGIAGPAPLAKLIKYAMRCGIGASLRTVMRNLSAVSGGAELAITPDQHVMRLIQLPSSTRVVAPHFYSFGGAVETAQWIGRVVSRDFVVDPAESGFLIGAARRQ
jgi:methylenetetrahydrofolate reductase (NADPH)